MTIDPRWPAFVAHLHRGGRAGYFWRAGRSTWWNGDGPPTFPSTDDLYFGVHPTIQAGGPHDRARNATVAALNCMYADIDAKRFGSKGAAMAHIEQLPAQPSVLIDSGGGYHAYWLLDTPWVLTSQDERQRAQAAQGAWVALVGGDPGAKDLARILRVPGTSNTKYTPPRDVVFVHCDLDRRYTLAELLDLLPKPAPGPAHATRTACNDRRTAYAAKARADELNRVAQAAVGTRNDTLNTAAYTLGRKVAAGLLEQPEVERDLVTAAVTAGLSEREAIATARSGVRAGIAAGAPDTLPDFDVPQTRRRTAPTLADAAEAGGQAQQPTQALSARILDVLVALGYTFRLNRLHDRIEVNQQELDDVHLAAIRMQARDAGLRGMDALHDVITAEAARNAYHPVHDYLNALYWDGADRIEALAECLVCTAPAVHTAEGPRSLSYIYLHRWLVGAVAKALAGEQNAMLVLHGPQGCGKSDFVRWIGSALPELFAEGPIVETKDCSLRLATRWIWEVAELDATTRKADVAYLKDVISRREVTERRAYARFDTTKPALASFIGTVNEERFLADTTGNRRFWVLSLERLDWRYTALDIHQVWAQAVAEYRAGASWRLSAAEAAAQTAVNEAHEVGDVLEGWLERHFERIDPELDTAGLTTADIIDHLRTHDVPVSDGRGIETRIGNVLRRWKIPKRSGPTRGTTRRFYGLRKA